MSAAGRREFVSISHSPLILDDLPESPGAVFRAASERVRDAIAAYDPELVVFFGTEHRRTLTEIVPAFTIGQSAIGYGDWNLPEAAYDVPHAVATTIAEGVLEAGIDVAFAPSLRLDHGFGLTWRQLLGSFDARPLVPILINCAISPLCVPARAAALGDAVAQALDGTPERVLFVASGGLSHSPPAVNPVMAQLPEAERQAATRALLDDAGKRINEDWDRQFLQLVERGDIATLAALTTGGIAAGGPGAQEVRTWIAVAGATARPAAMVSYEPVAEWITGMGIATSFAV